MKTKQNQRSFFFQMNKFLTRMNDMRAREDDVDAIDGQHAVAERTRLRVRDMPAKQQQFGRHRR